LHRNHSAGWMRRACFLASLHRTDRDGLRIARGTPPKGYPGSSWPTLCLRPHSRQFQGLMPGSRRRTYYHFRLRVPFARTRSILTTSDVFYRRTTNEPDEDLVCHPGDVSVLFCVIHLWLSLLSRWGRITLRASRPHTCAIPSMAADGLQCAAQNDERPLEEAARAKTADRRARRRDGLLELVELGGHGARRCLSDKLL
jgi:hypothetical protein